MLGLELHLLNEAIVHIHTNIMIFWNDLKAGTERKVF